MKTEFLVDLRKVMTAESEHLHQKSWKKCDSSLEKVTTDPSKVRTSVTPTWMPPEAPVPVAVRSVTSTPFTKCVVGMQKPEAENLRLVVMH